MKWCWLIGWTVCFRKIASTFWKFVDCKYCFNYHLISFILYNQISFKLLKFYNIHLNACLNTLFFWWWIHVCLNTLFFWWWIHVSTHSYSGGEYMSQHTLLLVVNTCQKEVEGRRCRDRQVVCLVTKFYLWNITIKVESSGAPLVIKYVNNL
jgi:hypothetical protein